VSAAPSWRVAGTYLEACNCEAICPCRRVGGVSGGRSTYGECIGALSWQVVEGHDGDTDLAGLGVILACRYHDDEPGSPWRVVLFVDDRATPEQHAALAGIFSGDRGGTPMEHFPWAWKERDLRGVVQAKIEIDHTPRRGWFRAGSDVNVKVTGPADQSATVTCVIPGHDREGAEVITDFQFDTDAATLEVRGRCGFETGFEYSAS
jgi:hypothetical protein